MSDLQPLFDAAGSETEPSSPRPRPRVLRVFVVGLAIGIVMAGTAGWLMANLPYRHDPEGVRQFLGIVLFPFGEDLILATGLFRVPVSLATDNAVGAVLTAPFGFALALPISVAYGILLATCGTLLVDGVRRLVRATSRRAG